MGWPKKYIITGCTDQPLLTRWTFLETKKGKLRMHYFHRSDEDEELHDHPWPFITLILWGGYWEQTAAGKEWIRPGRLLYRPATWAHRVEMRAADGHALSLVWTFPECRQWGFFTKEGWRHWREFLGKKGCGGLD